MGWGRPGARCEGTARASQASVRLGFLDLPGRPPPRRHPRAKAMLTFSVVMSVSASWRFWVKMMLKTAWERLLVSFMFVAATVLGGRKSHAVTSHLGSGTRVAGGAGPPGRATRYQLPAPGDCASCQTASREHACPPHPPHPPHPPPLQPGTRGAVTGGCLSGPRGSAEPRYHLLSSLGRSPDGCDAGGPRPEGMPTAHPLWGGPRLPEGSPGVVPMPLTSRQVPRLGSLPDGPRHRGASSEQHTPRTMAEAGGSGGTQGALTLRGVPG